MSSSTNYPYYRNTTVRQLPKRQSPLAARMVAPGHYYDESTGLVKPAPSTPAPTPPSRKRGKK